MRIRVLHHAKKTELAVVELPETATVEDLNKEIKKVSRCSLTSSHCPAKTKNHI